MHGQKRHMAPPTGTSGVTSKSITPCGVRRGYNNLPLCSWESWLCEDWSGRNSVPFMHLTEHLRETEFEEVQNFAGGYDPFLLPPLPLCDILTWVASPTLPMARRLDLRLVLRYSKQEVPLSWADNLLQYERQERKKELGSKKFIFKNSLLGLPARPRPKLWTKCKRI